MPLKCYVTVVGSWNIFLKHRPYEGEDVLKDYFKNAWEMSP